MGAADVRNSLFIFGPKVVIVGVDVDRHRKLPITYLLNTILYWHHCTRCPWSFIGVFWSPEGIVLSQNGPRSYRSASIRIHLRAGDERRGYELTNGTCHLSVKGRPVICQ